MSDRQENKKRKIFALLIFLISLIIIGGAIYLLLSHFNAIKQPLIEPEPIVVVEPEPTVVVEPEPVIVVEPEPVVEPESEPVAVVEPEPVVEPESEPVAVVEPEPVIEPEPEPEAEVEPAPILIDVPEFEPISETVVLDAVPVDLILPEFDLIAENPTVEVAFEPEPVPEFAPSVEPVFEPEYEKEEEPLPIIFEPEQEELRIPDAPWIVESYYDEPWYAANIYDDDFFADFFVAGSELEYEDGLQNPYLYVNNEYFGTIIVDMRSNVPFVSKKDLQSMLLLNLTTDFADQLFANPDDYYSLEYIESNNIGVVYDSVQFAIYLTFTADQMPQETLSLGSAYSINRGTTKVDGLEDLSPASISLASNVSVYGNMNYNRSNMIPKLSISVSLSNMMSFCDLATDFNVTISPNNLYISSFSSYFDIIDKSIRLNLASVPIYSSLSSIPARGWFGVSMEKNYSYGTSVRRTAQYEQEIEVTEDCVLVVVMNGVIAFERNVKIGNYKLKDFAFVQGSNDIQIWQVPLGVDYEACLADPYLEDNNKIKKIYFNMGYDSSLLAKGEKLWKFSFALPYVDDDSKTFGFHFIDLNKNRLVLKFTDFAFGFEQSSGVTHTFTASNIFSLSGGYDKFNNQYMLQILDSFTLIKAFNYGTITLNGQFQLSDFALGSSFSLKDKLKYSFVISNKFNDERLAPLSLSASFDNYNKRISGSIGYSFSLDVLRFGLSSNLNYTYSNEVPKQKRFTWSASLSVSASFSQGLSLSAGLTTSSSIIKDTVPFKISVGISMLLGPNASMNARTDLNAVDAGLSIRPFGSKKSNFQFNLNGLDFAKGVLDHTLTASYSYSGNLVSLSVRQQFSNSYKNFTTTMSMNTGFVFADGMFGLTRSVGSSFLLIHPTGKMRNSDISIGKATASSTVEQKKFFGNVLYSNLAVYQHNGIVVFSSDGSSFGSGGTFLLGLSPRPRQGFVKVLSIQPTATVSAILLHADGTPYEQYSSPIYSVKLKEENGEKTYVVDELSSSTYFFTDDDGRFILSNLEPGMYCIDLNVPNEDTRSKDWYGYGIFFEVPKLVDSEVIVLENFQVGFGQGLELDGETNVTSYAATYMLKEVQRLSEDEFLNIIFASDMDEWADWDEDNWANEGGEAEINFDAAMDQFYGEQSENQSVAP